MTNKLVLGYSNFFISSLANLMLIPALYYCLSEVKISLWFNILALHSLLLLVDMGMTASATRALGLEWNENGYSAEYKKILNGYAYIYNKASMIASFAGLVFGLVYFDQVYKLNLEILTTFSIYVLAFFIYINNIFLVPVLKSIDRIEKVYLASIFSKVVYVTLSLFALLFLDLELVGVAISFLIGAGLNVLTLNYYANKNRINRPIREFSGLKNEKKKILKQGIISFCVFFQDKISILYVTSFVGFSSAAHYGLTAQIFTIITAVSNVYYNTVQPKIIENEVENRIDKNKILMLKAYIVQMLLIVFPSILIMLFFEPLSNFFSFNGKVLEANDLILYAIFILFFNVQLISVNYLLIKNDYTMTKWYLLTALIYFLMLLFFLEKDKTEVTQILIVQLISLFIINGWYWPYKVMKELGCVKWNQR